MRLYATSVSSPPEEIPLMKMVCTPAESGASISQYPSETTGEYVPPGRGTLTRSVTGGSTFAAASARNVGTPQPGPGFPAGQSPSPDPNAPLRIGKNSIVPAGNA